MSKQEKVSQNYKVGDIVQTTEAFGPNPPGSIGFIYETYPDQYGESNAVVSVLLTNGHDIGSFNEDEQSESLIWVGHTHVVYTYTSPGQLMADYRAGYFEQVFADSQSLAEQVEASSVEGQ